MFGLRVHHRPPSPREIVGLADLDEAKRLAVVDGQRLVREAQRKGDFPKDWKQIELRLRNRGVETRRDPTGTTLAPAYLRIPFSLEWTSGAVDTEDMRRAAVFALGLLRRRAPVLSGDYLASTSIYVGKTAVRPTQFRTMPLTETSRVIVAPNVEYASKIEKEFARRGYDTANAPALKGGVVRPVADMVRARFGNRINCRFVYAALGRTTGGTMPAIELGVPGAFTQNDAPVGRGRPRRRRR